MKTVPNVPEIDRGRLTETDLTPQISKAIEDTYRMEKEIERLFDQKEMDRALIAKLRARIYHLENKNSMTPLK